MKNMTRWRTAEGARPRDRPDTPPLATCERIYRPADLTTAPETSGAVPFLTTNR